MLNFLRQSVHELFDIDGRLSLTLKTHLLHPGLVSYEISKGKRAKYTPALRLYIVSSLLFFLVFSSFQHIFTPEAPEQTSTVEVYSRTMFVLFPLYALVIQCFYWRSFYLSNLVLSMHIHSVAYISLMIIGPLEAFESQSHLLILFQAVPAIYLAWYILKAFKVMYREVWWKTFLKSLSSYLAYMALLGFAFDVLLH